MFSVTEQTLEDITLLTLSGRVDNLGAVELEEALKDIIGRGRYRLVMDMTEVRYMNSSGMRVLTELRSDTHANGGDVYIAGLHPRVLHVFQIIGFDKFFTLFDTVEDALDAFQIGEME